MTLIAVHKIRIIFRLAEYSSGLDSTIPNHEAYQYIFDSLPMFIALVLFNVIHPGKIMPGKESDFPSRKERKNLFKTNRGDDYATILPRTEGAGDITMPLETTYRPKTEPEPPTYGYVQ